MSFTLATLKTAIQDYTDNSESTFVTHLPDFIKIDTQGSELDILKGGEKTISNCSLIYLECPIIEYNLGSPNLNDYINNVDTEDAVGSVVKVGSIVGVEMTNPGQSYTRAPLVTFQDSCNKGYGGYGRAVIDQNPSSPTFGQVTSVVIISEGENYPADIGELPLYIVDVIIENPGQDYEDDDIVVDDIVDIEIVDGRVTRVDVKEGFAFNGLPDLNIESSTGFGAVLRPIMSIVQPDGQGEIIQVIDCVS